MYKHLMILAAVGYAVWHWDKNRRDRNGREAENMPGVKADQVTDWESEGGALHGSGPQLGPEPSLH